MCCPFPFVHALIHVLLKLFMTERLSSPMSLLITKMAGGNDVGLLRATSFWMSMEVLTSALHKHRLSQRNLVFAGVAFWWMLPHGFTAVVAFSRLLLIGFGAWLLERSPLVFGHRVRVIVVRESGTWSRMKRSINGLYADVRLSRNLGL